MKKIDLNFKDPEPEAEELTANRVVADILTRQSTAWFWAMQQRNVQRLWELWCESAEAYLHKRTKQRLSTVKAQTGRGQVRLKTQRRRATAPSAISRRSTKSSDAPWSCSSWQDKQKISSDNFTGTLRWLVVSVLFHGACSACEIWRRTAEIWEAIW